MKRSSPAATQSRPQGPAEHSTPPGGVGLSVLDRRAVLWLQPLATTCPGASAQAARAQTSLRLPEAGAPSLMSRLAGGREREGQVGITNRKFSFPFPPDCPCAAFWNLPLHSGAQGETRRGRATALSHRHVTGARPGHADRRGHRHSGAVRHSGGPAEQKPTDAAEKQQSASGTRTRNQHAAGSDLCKRAHRISHDAEERPLEEDAELGEAAGREAVTALRGRGVLGTHGGRRGGGTPGLVAQQEPRAAGRRSPPAALPGAAGPCVAGPLDGLARVTSSEGRCQRKGFVSVSLPDSLL